eukprot:TRINITY_DN19972_c0_g1_i1.p1 TRINITY_DN19972_c0_g1~~TRINITY_DN19972_c0_g1_i1.p1  ORF type:complete len:435 (+),score=86.48 TRINITY_DN19972_c0_g1_i1:40-1344(+)
MTIKCRVYNASSVELNNEVMIQYKTEGETGMCSCSTPTLKKDTWTELCLPEESFGSKVIPTSALLQLRAEGITWEDTYTPHETEEEDTQNIVFENGKDYRLVNDSVNPPLTDEEYYESLSVLRDILEGFGPIKPPHRDDKKQQQSLWRHIARKIGRDVKKPGCLKSVENMVTGRTGYKDSRVKWRKVMSSHRHAPVPTKFETPEEKTEIVSSVDEGKVFMEIYHRAMDRFPGGNCDVIVVKHSMDFASKQGFVCAYRNFDGTPCIHPARALSKGEVEKHRRKLLPRLSALLSHNSPASWVFNSTVDDAQKDDNEYDTEWSSIDILCYRAQPQDKDCQPFARVHQYALCKNWYSFMGKGDSDSDTVVPTPLAQAVLNEVENTLRIGRPEKFSEDETDVKLSENGWEVSNTGYVFPLILNDSLYNPAAAVGSKRKL